MSYLFNITHVVGRLDLSVNAISIADGINTIEPLIFFIIGMAIYSIFVFKFYRFLARRDIFKLELWKHRHKGLAKLGHLVKAIFLFPIVAFAWFIIMSVLMMMISKVGDIAIIFQISIAYVSSVRITAYYNEDLSRDLAKMIPFSLLAIFLLDIYDVAFSSSMAMLRMLPSMWETIFYYLVFVIVLEAVLRLIIKAKGGSKRKGMEEKPELPEPPEGA